MDSELHNQHCFVSMTIIISTFVKLSIAVFWKSWLLNLEFSSVIIEITQDDKKVKCWKWSKTWYFKSTRRVWRSKYSKIRILLEHSWNPGWADPAARQGEQRQTVKSKSKTWNSALFSRIFQWQSYRSIDFCFMFLMWRNKYRFSRKNL